MTIAPLGALSEETYHPALSDFSDVHRSPRNALPCQC